MTKPKSFRSSFTCVYLVGKELYQALLKTINNVQYDDLERFNSEAEDKLSSIFDGDSNAAQMPSPVVKISDPINSSTFEHDEEIPLYK